MILAVATKLGPNSALADTFSTSPQGWSAALRQFSEEVRRVSKDAWSRGQVYGKQQLVHTDLVE